jgi:hypothetical protein
VSDGILFVLLPFITAAALGFGFFVVFRERAAARRSGPARRLVEPDLAAPPRDPGRAPDRPWWASPWIWLTACAVFLVLGIVVWPGLFGGTFLFLPFVWIWRPRRRPEIDPRTNGHGRAGGPGSFTAP